MPICFVIMPFGQTTTKHTKEYWDDHFERFIKPAIEKASDGQKSLEYRARRADSAGGEISDDVFNNLLREADVVLADLTDANPNVMYELGIRHAVQNHTIMIVEKGQERAIPFYFQPYRAIPYSVTNSRDTNDFNHKIQQRLLDISQPGIQHSDNPISSYLQKKEQFITFFSNRASEQNAALVSGTGFNAIYTPNENSKRNIRKEAAIRAAKQHIRLLASSGHAYLYRYSSPFRKVLQERLRDNVSTQIILENPWSADRILLTLSELSTGSSMLKHIQKAALEKFQQGAFNGFDPVALIEQGNHYDEKYQISLSGYEELERLFSKNIELRIATYPVPVTILLTEATGFIELYLRAYQQPRIDQPMTTFELEFSSSNYLYRVCSDYLDTLWRLSLQRSEFTAQTEFWKQHLREEFEENERKTNPPGSPT